MVVHLRNIFLFSRPVAQMLLTPRWVSRREDVKQLFIAVEGKHSTSLGTTLSPNPNSVEEGTYFPLFTP